MIVGLTITSHTDHATFTINDGNFVLTDSPFTIFHGPLQENGQEFFNMTLTSNAVYLQQRDGDFDQLNFFGNVELPDGSQFLTYSVNRGGIGDILLQVNTASQGTSSPPVNGDYAIPLTSSAILYMEKNNLSPSIALKQKLS